MDDRLDVIILGATGFTGTSTVSYLVRILKKENLNLTWGIAGRSEEKLKNVIKQLETETGNVYKDIPIIKVDVKDEASLKSMTSKAKIIINTVGPYRYYGEPVVKSCLNTSTHHVDVSGESSFVEGIQLKYHEIALKLGVYIISTCGVGCIPTDMGVVFLQDNFKGTLNSVEAYSMMKYDSKKYPGPNGHVGTWESILLCIAHPFELYQIRTEILSKMGSPNLQPKLKNRFIHKSEVVNKWAAPLPEPDRPTVVRSQRYLYQLYNKRPVQIETYAAVEKFYYLILIGIFGFIAVVFAQFKFTRHFLLEYPEYFSLGFFSKKGPSKEKQENTIHETVLYGKGWSEKLLEPTDQFKTEPNKTIKAKVTGRNPGYGETCVCLCLSAIVILLEKDKLPNNGGCYPPGAAFSRTSLIQRLNRNGVTFEIISNKK